MTVNDITNILLRPYFGIGILLWLTFIFIFFLGGYFGRKELKKELEEKEKQKEEIKKELKEEMKSNNHS